MQRVWSAGVRSGALATLAALAWGGVPAVASAQQAAPANGYEVLFKGLHWRNVGPNRGGRSQAVAGSAARPFEYYFGATGGGVWKTTDGGQSWKPVTDGQIHSSSPGALAVCEANPDVVYVGMGETELRGNIIQGDGVYKTTDAGKTWKHIGLENTQAIGAIRVAPRNCDDVFVAAFGHPYGLSPDRGVYHSTDGGQSWQKVLYRDDKTGAIDLSMDPSNPNTVYATLWDAQRTSWSLSSGGPGSGIFKTTDGGAHWTELTRNPGLPKGILGKIGVAVSPADPNRVYALVEAQDGGLFRSDDAGATWTKMNDEQKIRQRAFYYTRITADPKDKNRVYVMNVGFLRSDDGGKTFPKQIRPPHGDNHRLWIASNDPNRMAEVNDGGAAISVNGGETWTAEDYPTAQLYHVWIDQHDPYFVCGAQQDNSTACVASKGWGFMAGRNNGVGYGGSGDYFYGIGGGESGYIASSSAYPDIYFAGNYGGNFTAFDRSNGQSRRIDPWPDNPMGYPSGKITERFQWTAPIVVDPRDPKTVYVGSQHLFRTRNGGQSWEKLSGDLTLHDPATMGPSGGPITKDHSGVETYATIFTIAPSPLQSGVIWTGSDDGLVYITKDDGKSWTNVTPKDLPKYARIQLIEAGHFKPGTAYLAASRYQTDDLGLYAYRTEDFGQTWTKITNGIRQGDFVRAVREDPERAGLLYAGTEHGIYVSFDDGADWKPLSLELPDVQVPDIAVLHNDLVIATHGRSAYIMDGGAATLRQMTPEALTQSAHLFDPVDPVRSVDMGVTVYYSLEKPAQQLSLEFLDAQGKVIERFDAKKADLKAAPRARDEDDDDEDYRRPRQAKNAPNKAGLNEFVWTMRYPGPVTFPKMVWWAASPVGPRAPTGTYSVRLTVDGQAQTQPFEIRMDPRLEGVTDADLQAQFQFASQIQERVSAANRAVIRVRSIRDQLHDRVQKARDARLQASADAFVKKITAVEEAIHQTRSVASEDPLNFPIRLNNKLAALEGVVESADARPTDQSHAVFQDLSAQLDVQLSALDQAVKVDLARLNDQLKAKGLQPVDPDAAPAAQTADEGDDGR